MEKENIDLSDSIDAALTGIYAAVLNALTGKFSGYIYPQLLDSDAM